MDSTSVLHQLNVNSTTTQILYVFMIFKEEMTKTSEYGEEFNEQQKVIEQEEKLIQQYEKDFTEKLMKHNINNTFNHSDTTTRYASKHAQKLSIVLYDNSFPINHQLQVEIGTYFVINETYFVTYIITSYCISKKHLNIFAILYNNANSAITQQQKYMLYHENISFICLH